MSYLNFLTRIFTQKGSDNTPEGAIIRSGGKHITNIITLNANNTSAKVNVFQLKGVVKIMSIHAELTAKTTLTNCTSVYFDLYDGTISVPITKTTGASMSGYNVGAFLTKDADVSSSITILNNDQARIKEASTGTKINTELLMIQKSSTDTFIRFNYTTTDAPADAELTVHMVWADIDSGMLIAV